MMMDFAIRPKRTKLTEMNAREREREREKLKMNFFLLAFVTFM